jgi:hypothetical protein
MAAPLAAVGIGATLVSGFVGAAGDLFKGQAESNMYNFQAGIAQMRAKVATQNAEWARQSGEENALISGLRSRFQIGQIKAGQGASNIAVGSGSPAAVRAGQTEMAQLDESIIRTNAARRAFGQEVEAAADTAQAGAYRVAADTSITAGEIGAAGSILGGATGVSSKWLQASQYGIPGFTV